MPQRCEVSFLSQDVPITTKKRREGELTSNSYSSDFLGPLVPRISGNDWSRTTLVAGTLSLQLFREITHVSAVIARMKNEAQVAQVVIQSLGHLSTNHQVSTLEALGKVGTVTDQLKFLCDSGPLSELFGSSLKLGLDEGAPPRVVDLLLELFNQLLDRFQVLLDPFWSRSDRRSVRDSLINRSSFRQMERVTIELE